MAKEKKNTMTLREIIKFNRGLNVLANSSIGFEDVDVSFELSMFKLNSKKHVTAFQEVVDGLTGTDAEKDKATEVLLDKEYELTAPKLTLKVIKTSVNEVPLLAFDYLAEFITK